MTFSKKLRYAHAIASCAIGFSVFLASKPAFAAKPEVDIQSEMRPLSEILSQAASATSSKISIEPEIRTWKATVAFRGSLSEFLSVLAQNFDLSVERTVSESKAAFRVYLPKSTRNHLANYYAANRRRKLDEQKSDSALLRNAIAGLREKPGENANGALPDTGVLGPLLNALGPEALQQLTLSDRGTSSPGKPSFGVPLSRLSPQQRGVVRQFLEDTQSKWNEQSPGGVGTNLLEDGLRRLDSARLEFWTLNEGGYQRFHMSVRFPGMSWSPDFPVLASRAGNYQPPVNGETKIAGGPKTLQRDGGKAKPPNDLEQHPLTLRLETANYAETMLKIAEAAHINIVADAFTLRERIAAYPKNQPLGDVLDRVDKAFNVRNRWAGGTLLVRSRSWEDRLEEEPPATILDYLVGKVKKDPFLTSSELAYAAVHLTETQVRGLGNWHDTKRNLAAEAGSILKSYPLYVWAGQLSEEEWKRLKGTGLRRGALDARKITSLMALSGLGPDFQSVSTLKWREGTDQYPPVIALELHDSKSNLISELR